MIETAIAKACISKMTGKETLTAVIVIALAVTAWAMHKTYVENEKNVRLAELHHEDIKDILQSQEFAKKEDKEKTKMLIDALKHNEVASER